MSKRKILNYQGVEYIYNSKENELLAIQQDKTEKHTNCQVLLDMSDVTILQLPVSTLFRPYNMVVTLNWNTQKLILH